MRNLRPPIKDSISNAMSSNQSNQTPNRPMHSTESKVYELP